MRNRTPLNDMPEKQIGWKFDNTYAKLPKSFLTKIKPTPVKNPETVIFNHDLSKEIGLDFSLINDKEIALIFSGNKLPHGAESISQAYAGHQFGHFTVLGDGRAHLLGEHVMQNKKRIDIQFKGSGPTPYSRNADGRASLGPMLREYLISESMNSLGISTTRSLAVVKTGEDIIRETKLKGAILTRIASSHIRVGTFQYALITKDRENLNKLFNYTVNRHYPHIKNTKSPAAELLKIVIEKQIDLIIDWMRVGFIHGVMNTDNMTISGETIDYGPCAFMDTYDPKTVFSSIDLHGRYAYYNQPAIAKWNLERFAESLIPLINKDENLGLEIAYEVMNSFTEKYKKSWIEMMKKKLGLVGSDVNDQNLILDLLTWMHKNKADYTNTFCSLMDKLSVKNEIFNDRDFLIWKKKWEKRVGLNNNTLAKSHEIMKKANPLLIPRNHIVEKILSDVEEKKNLDGLNEFLEVIKDPYKTFPMIEKFQSTSDKKKETYVTYCGT